MYRKSWLALGAAAAICLFAPAPATAQSPAAEACAFLGRGLTFDFSPGGGGRAALRQRTVRCLQSRAKSTISATAPADGAGFTTFDPPGSTFTVPSAITPDGEIAGYFTDASGLTHGFLRGRHGRITTFDPPGSTLTQATSINPDGEIAGAYCDTAGCAREHGFLRRRDGTFTTFDAPGVSSNILPGLYNPGGPPPSVTPAGAIAGTYSVPGQTEHGFLRARNGALTTIDVPGATFTEVLAINPGGAIIGDFCTPLTTCFTGFLRTPDGTLTTISIPGSCGGGSIPFAINPEGTVVGGFSDPSCSVAHGYLRAPNGTITTFDAPGPALNFEPLAINPAGVVAGYIFTDTSHGFLRTPDGAITTFDVPGSSSTFAFEINPEGAIIGSYSDASGVFHGFMRLPWSFHD